MPSQKILPQAFFLRGRSHGERDRPGRRPCPEEAGTTLSKRASQAQAQEQERRGAHCQALAGTRRVQCIYSYVQYMWAPCSSKVGPAFPCSCTVPCCADRRAYACACVCVKYQVQYRGGHRLRTRVSDRIPCRPTTVFRPKMDGCLVQYILCTAG